MRARLRVVPVFVGATLPDWISSRAQRETYESVASHDDPLKADSLALGVDAVRLASKFRGVRAMTVELARPLSPEDCCVQ